MIYVLRCLGIFLIIITLREPVACFNKGIQLEGNSGIKQKNSAISEEKIAKLVEKKDQSFVLRAEKVTATDGKPVLLKLTLVYISDKPLRIDQPVSGICQPGNNRPPWVWIDAPAGWEDRPEAFRDAFPNQDNSLHSSAVTLKRGDHFESTIPLHWRFRQIPLGRSKIRVTWPIFGDTFAPSWSPDPLAKPTVTVPVILNPRIVRKEPHDSSLPRLSSSAGERGTAYICDIQGNKCTLPFFNLF